jgi:hypothetical protein
MGSMFPRKWMASAASSGKTIFSKIRLSTFDDVLGKPLGSLSKASASCS